MKIRHFDTPDYCVMSMPLLLYLLSTRKPRMARTL